jgi:hypothetical protein
MLRLADKCAQLALLRESGGCLPEPQWFYCLGVPAFCTDGDPKAHEWSSREFENYRQDETQGKLDHWRTKTGPTTCERIGSQFPDRCSGCQFKGKITSPIELGRESGPHGARSGSDYQTDLGNARRLVARHGSNIRYVPEWHKWIVWDAAHWRVDDDGAIMRFGKETVVDMHHEALKLDDERKRTELIKHALKCQAAGRARRNGELSDNRGRSCIVRAAARR